MAAVSASSPDGPVPCTACRGTGSVISGLGGTPHAVVCPWCRGSGVRPAEIDAQEHPSEGGGETAPPAASVTT